MAHLIASLKVDTRQVRARMKVGSVIIHIVVWMPIPWAWKHKVSDWLVKWVTAPLATAKVSVD